MSALRRKFSQQMKLAYVTPIFKKGDKLDSTIYRTISVSPSFFKNFLKPPSDSDDGVH